MESFSRKFYAAARNSRCLERGEYIYTFMEFKEFLEPAGILHEHTVPRTPEKYGAAKTMKRTLVETLQSSLMRSFDIVLVRRTHVYSCLYVSLKSISSKGHWRNDSFQSMDEEEFLSLSSLCLWSWDYCTCTEGWKRNKVWFQTQEMQQKFGTNYNMSTFVQWWDWSPFELWLLCMQLDLKLHQVNVAIAFLDGKL